MSKHFTILGTPYGVGAFVPVTDLEGESPAAALSIYFQTRTLCQQPAPDKKAIGPGQHMITRSEATIAEGETDCAAFRAVPKIADLQPA